MMTVTAEEIKNVAKSAGLGWNDGDKDGEIIVGTSYDHGCLLYKKFIENGAVMWAVEGGFGIRETQ